MLIYVYILFFIQHPPIPPHKQKKIHMYITKYIEKVEELSVCNQLNGIIQIYTTTKQCTSDKEKIFGHVFEVH